MSWFSKAAKKLYRWKEAAKPNEVKKIVEPYASSIVGILANPVIGLAVDYVHNERKKWEARNFPELDPSNIYNVPVEVLAPPPPEPFEPEKSVPKVPVDRDPSPLEVLFPPPVVDTTPNDPTPSFTPEPWNQYSGNYGVLPIGGIPVSIFTQLGKGLMQQTPAVIQTVAKAAGSRGGSTTQRRRKKKAASAGRVSRPRKRKSGGKIRASARKGSRMAKAIKKGSAAAKAWGRKMARLRK